MKNTIEISSDGINVYAQLRVKANKVGQVILSVMIVLLVTLFFFLLASIDADELGSFLIPLVLIFTLIITFPVRFLVWNLVGKEHLIVNTKTINYYYDYGIIRTSMKTIPYERLGTGFEKVQAKNGIEKGNLLFYNFRKEDLLPQVIHQTTVLVDLEKIHQLDNEIQAIFLNEFQDKHGFIGISLN
jgi:hypothetical protein